MPIDYNAIANAGNAQRDADVAAIMALQQQLATPTYIQSKQDRLQQRAAEKALKFTPDTLLGMSDADSYITSNIQGNTRAVTAPGNFNYDAVELAHNDGYHSKTAAEGIEASPSKLATQPQYVANMLQKPVDQLTEQDYIDVGNMQQIQALSDLAGGGDWKAPLIRGVEQTNLTGYYKDENENKVYAPLNVPITSHDFNQKDFYGKRELVSYGDAKGNNITQKLALDPKQNVNWQAEIAQEKYGIQSKSNYQDIIDRINNTSEKQPLDTITGNDILDGVKTVGTTVAGFIPDLADVAMEAGLWVNHNLGDPAALEKLSEEELKGSTAGWLLGLKKHKDGTLYSTIFEGGKEQFDKWAGVDTQRRDSAQKAIVDEAYNIYKDKDMTATEKATALYNTLGTNISVLPTTLGAVFGFMATMSVGSGSKLAAISNEGNAAKMAKFLGIADGTNVATRVAKAKKQAGLKGAYATKEGATVWAAKNPKAAAKLETTIANLEKRFAGDKIAITGAGIPLAATTSNEMLDARHENNINDGSDNYSSLYDVLATTALAYGMNSIDLVTDKLAISPHASNLLQGVTKTFAGKVAEAPSKSLAKQALLGAMKLTVSAAGKISEAVVVEGSTEGLQQAIQVYAEKWGTDAFKDKEFKELYDDEAIKEIVGSTVMGALAGGNLKAGAMAIGAVTNASNLTTDELKDRFKKKEPEPVEESEATTEVKSNMANDITDLDYVDNNGPVKTYTVEEQAKAIKDTNTEDVTLVFDEGHKPSEEELQISRDIDDVYNDMVDILSTFQYPPETTAEQKSQVINEIQNGVDLTLNELLEDRKKLEEAGATPNKLKLVDSKIDLLVPMRTAATVDHMQGILNSNTSTAKDQVRAVLGSSYASLEDLQRVKEAVEADTTGSVTPYEKKVLDVQIAALDANDVANEKLVKGGVRPSVVQWAARLAAHPNDETAKNRVVNFVTGQTTKLKQFNDAIRNYDITAGIYNKDGSVGTYKVLIPGTKERRVVTEKEFNKYFPTVTDKAAVRSIPEYRDDEIPITLGGKTKQFKINALATLAERVAKEQPVLEQLLELTDPSGKAPSKPQEAKKDFPRKSTNDTVKKPSVAPNDVATEAVDKAPISGAERRSSEITDVAMSVINNGEPNDIQFYNDYKEEIDLEISRIEKALGEKSNIASNNSVPTKPVALSKKDAATWDVLVKNFNKAEATGNAKASTNILQTLNKIAENGTYSVAHKGTKKPQKPIEAKDTNVNIKTPSEQSIMDLVKPKNLTKADARKWDSNFKLYEKYKGELDKLKKEFAPISKIKTKSAQLAKKRDNLIELINESQKPKKKRALSGAALAKAEASINNSEGSEDEAATKVNAVSKARVTKAEYSSTLTQEDADELDRMEAENKANLAKEETKTKSKSVKESKPKVTEDIIVSKDNVDKTVKDLEDEGSAIFGIASNEGNPQGTKCKKVEYGM